MSLKVQNEAFLPNPIYTEYTIGHKILLVLNSKRDIFHQLYLKVELTLNSADSNISVHFFGEYFSGYYYFWNIKSAKDTMPTLVYSSGFIVCVYTPNSIFLPAWSCLVCSCVCAHACTHMHVYTCVLSSILFIIFCCFYYNCFLFVWKNSFSNSIFDFTFPVPQLLPFPPFQTTPDLFFLSLFH